MPSQPVANLYGTLDLWRSVFTIQNRWKEFWYWSSGNLQMAERSPSWKRGQTFGYSLSFTVMTEQTVTPPGSEHESQNLQREPPFFMHQRSDEIFSSQPQMLHTQHRHKGCNM